MNGLLLLVLAVLCTVECAPVELKQETKRRETTKETLELENALKRLAGENKKFYPGPGLQPLPQVDGLEDPVERSEEAPPAVLQGLPEDEDVIPKDVINGEEEQEEKDDIQPENQSEDESNLEPVETSQSQDEDDSNNDEADDGNSEEQYLNDLGQHRPADKMQENNEAVPMYYNNDPSQGMTRLDQEQQQQGYRDMYTDIYKGDYTPFANGDIDGDGEDEDYLVQDVISMMEQHPELWARLLQARNMAAEEEESEPEYEDRKQGEPDDKEDEDEEEQLQNIGEMASGPLDRANELYNSREEEALQKMKALQQYERLQDLYGDKDAHVVAKKQGYGPMLDVYQQSYPNELYGLPLRGEENDHDGSGEEESPRYSNKVRNKNYETDENSISGKPVYKMPLM